MKMAGRCSVLFISFDLWKIFNNSITGQSQSCTSSSILTSRSERLKTVWLCDRSIIDLVDQLPWLSINQTVISFFYFILFFGLFFYLLKLGCLYGAAYSPNNWLIIGPTISFNLSQSIFLFKINFEPPSIFWFLMKMNWLTSESLKLFYSMWSVQVLFLYQIGFFTELKGLC